MFFFQVRLSKKYFFQLKDGRSPHGFDRPIGTALKLFDKKCVRGDSQPSPVARKQIVYLPPYDGYVPKYKKVVKLLFRERCLLVIK